MEDKLRIAIVDKDKCKPKKCRHECKRSCPVVKVGKMCIEVNSTSKRAFLSETLCIGCGICTKQCPFGAITIINLPKGMEGETIHRYGENQFKLHRLPTPKPGQVLGLVGSNGLGKSLALKVLAGKLIPNLGFHNERYEPSWEEVMHHFRGSELQNYFIKLMKGEIRPVIKPQYVDQIPSICQGTVRELLKKRDQIGGFDTVVRELEMENYLDNPINVLSGGELQRFAIAITYLQDANVYMFDEPSSYLDIKQRLKAAKLIRQIVVNNPDKYVIVVEHDLSVLDYLSDFVCILYGMPSIYGVITMPFSVREGINIFLDGFVPTENVRFRETSLTFRISDNLEEIDEKTNKIYKYPDIDIKLGTFELNIQGGSFSSSEIIVLLAENACGKTTFIKLLAGCFPDKHVMDLKISYKPQKINPTKDISVRSLLFEKLNSSWQHPQFQTDVCKPLKLDDLLDRDLKSLSGGELQKVAVILALGKPADVYLIDEPSAYLDSEQRIIVAKAIKRFVLHSHKTAFIVEHDFIMASYLANRVILFDGIPSIKCKATAPQSFISGMNAFLMHLDVTFRRDPTNFRPRLNKYDSQMDKEQKELGQYFHCD
jgi:ATP-binding cassette subfamily E protein 1